MSGVFRTSDEFDEQAHRLYNEGRYDEALALLRDGLALYPEAVDLHVGTAYAWLAREDVAWARQAFDRALQLDPDHEDALAGSGESLLKIGEFPRALAAFERILTLGFQEDGDLMLQIGRALFREGHFVQAHRFFDLAVTAQPGSSDAAACLGYTCHRLGRDDDGLYWVRRALEIEPRHGEARVYLANALYDRGENEAALYQLERTLPEDHVEELAIWRIIELKKCIYRLPDDDPELVPWFTRISELAGDPDPVDDLLAEIEATQQDGTLRDPHQLELFGALLSGLQAMQRRPGTEDTHVVTTLGGLTLRGTWDQILRQFKAVEGGWDHASLSEFMQGLAARGRAETGVVIPLSNAEAFIRGSIAAGVLRLVQ